MDRGRCELSPLQTSYDEAPFSIAGVTILEKDLRTRSSLFAPMQLDTQSRIFSLLPPRTPYNRCKSHRAGFSRIPVF